ncbi:hypothetical protein AZF37_06345 [endosymbiont 'TC1' of Trimyema compressum]|uniref:hypothetical protein n=1 Tax=endosymbiont 'TC1' of Trimyema compressum TaxID=243899 RepID=UPI0007F08A2D|nr:hypothetical protein [endosymbiont 'TC1' of Trimyema compressum]AMP20843.1 hypothetical protein AZF37_06345 [endosymbiont 'TC1' of Trimyema compressum]
MLNSLTDVFIEKPMFAIWRIIALSEIPFSIKLEYTKRVVDYIEEFLGTSSGFTLTGKGTDLLPCYNVGC